MKTSTLREVLAMDADDVCRWAYDLPHGKLTSAANSLAEVATNPSEDPGFRLKALQALKALPPHARLPGPEEHWPTPLLKRVHMAAELALVSSSDKDLQAASSALLRRVVDLVGKQAKTRWTTEMARSWLGFRKSKPLTSARD